MKKIKVWLMMALCAVIASCTANEEEGLGINDSQTIVLRIGSAANTKAVETPGTSSDKATLTNGYMFFATNNGAIRRCYKLLESGTTNIAKLEVSVTDITKQEGYTFDNVPGDVAKVYILANVPESGETTESTIRSKTTLAGVKALNIQVTDQADFEKVTMDGEGNVTGEGNKKEVTVNLQVFCSRLEIPSLTASGDITSFKVKGIYVSHFYKQVPLTEVVSSADGNLYKYTSANAGDYTTTYKMLADVEASDGAGIGETSDKTVSAGTDKAWAYQFIPGASGSGREGIRVVIALSNITGSGSYSGTQYLNIRGLVANTNSDPNPTAMSLERGKIYNMGANLTFDEGDLSPVPNPDDISLTVKITVTPWGVETVKPIL